MNLWRDLSRSGALVAYVVFGTHVVAAIVMVVVLRHGLPDPGTTPATRLDFIQRHPWSWSFGWLLWQIAALSLLALYASLARRWWRQSPVMITLALLCSSAAFAADVAGQSLYMGMPARLDPAAHEKLEIAAGLITGYAGNGLYTLAGVVLTLAGLRDLPRRVLAVSALLWSSGLLLAVASIMHSVVLQQVSTGAMLGSLFGWTLALGSWLRQAPRARVRH